MRRRLFLIMAALSLACAADSVARAETTSDLFTFRLIAPGTNMTLDMEQTAAFPLGCPHLFLVSSGTGTLTVTLQKNDITGDVIFMLGIAASGEGTAYIYRIGESKGLITQSVALGSKSQPYGFVWLYSGVVYSAISPKYSYTIQLSFEP